VLLDLVERQHASPDAVLQPLEGAWNLADALRRIVRRVPLNRVVIDDRPQHDRVVGVQPKGDLLFTRHLADRGRGDEGQESVELAALRLEGAVVDVAVADIEIEQLVEGFPARGVGERLLARRKDRKARREGRKEGKEREARTGNEHRSYRTQRQPLFAD